jgi:hypothetical protein
MTIESVSVKIAALSAASAMAIQSAAPGGSSMLSLIIPVVSALLGGAMSYAMLQTTVKRMERDVRDMRQDMGQIYSLLRDSLTKIAHIEGRLERSE